jgi:hypothetical protein
VNRLLNLFQRKPSPSYKILKTQDGGYVAIHRDNLDRWWMLHANGRSGVSLESLPGHEEIYVVKTKELAGQRINKHSRVTTGFEQVWP